MIRSDGFGCGGDASFGNGPPRDSTREYDGLQEVNKHKNGPNPTLLSNCGSPGGGRTGRLRLIDFGACNNTTPTAPGYTAPEVYEEAYEEGAGEESRYGRDMWALGAALTHDTVAGHTNDTAAPHC